MDSVRDRIVGALIREHYRRAEEKIEDSPEGHSAAMADVVMEVIQKTPSSDIFARIAEVILQGSTNGLCSFNEPCDERDCFDPEHRQAMGLANKIVDEIAPDLDPELPVLRAERDAAEEKAHQLQGYLDAARDDLQAMGEKISALEAELEQMKPTTLLAAGKTWERYRNLGSGCWHPVGKGYPCRSFQGLLDEHGVWIRQQMNSVVKSKINKHVRRIRTWRDDPRASPTILGSIISDFVADLNTDESKESND